MRKGNTLAMIANSKNCRLSGGAANQTNVSIDGVPLKTASWVDGHLVADCDLEPGDLVAFVVNPPKGLYLGETKP